MSGRALSPLEQAVLKSVYDRFPVQSLGVEVVVAENRLYDAAKVKEALVTLAEAGLLEHAPSPPRYRVVGQRRVEAALAGDVVLLGTGEGADGVSSRAGRRGRLSGLAERAAVLSSLGPHAPCRQLPSS